jgi:protein-S-isoprenylcysteine O-methyltransferase Ste14
MRQRAARIKNIRSASRPSCMNVPTSRTNLWISANGAPNMASGTTVMVRTEGDVEHGRRRINRLLVLLSRWRIEIAFALGIVALAIAQPTFASIEEFLPLTFAGLSLRLWARGHLTRRARLTQTGPYAWVRHPLYVGSFLLGLSFSLMGGAVFLPAIFTIVFAAMYVPKALREEAFLRARYGRQHTDYASRVGALVPRAPSLRRRRADTSTPPDTSAIAGRFRWRRVLQHREERTWLGALAALGAMWAAANGWGDRLTAMLGTYSLHMMQALGPLHG